MSATDPCLKAASLGQVMSSSKQWYRQLKASTETCCKTWLRPPVTGQVECPVLGPISTVWEGSKKPSAPTLSVKTSGPQRPLHVGTWPREATSGHSMHPSCRLLFVARGKRAAGFGADFQNSCCQISWGPVLCVRDHGGRPGFLSAWGLGLDRGKPKRNVQFKWAFKTRNHESMMCDREHSASTTALTTGKLWVCDPNPFSTQPWDSPLLHSWEITSHLRDLFSFKDAVSCGRG